MQQIRSRLTYANVMVTILALVVLGAGTAYAASHLGKNSVGTKQLKRHSVTATKIKRNAVTAAAIQNGSVTGAKVNTATLGTVPSATSAATANSAKTAALAATISGYSRKGMFRLGATPAASFKAGLETAPQSDLFSSGPLTVYAQCFSEGSSTEGVISIKTSMNGVIFDSNSDLASGDPYYLDTDTEAAERELLDESTGTNEANFFGGLDTEFSAIAPDGTTVKGSLAIGVKNGNLPTGNGLYGAGNACVFAGDMTTLNG